MEGLLAWVDTHFEVHLAYSYCIYVSDKVFVEDTSCSCIYVRDQVFVEDTNCYTIEKWHIVLAECHICDLLSLFEGEWRDIRMLVCLAKHWILWIEGSYPSRLCAHSHVYYTNSLIHFKKLGRSHPKPCFNWKPTLSQQTSVTTLLVGGPPALSVKGRILTCPARVLELHVKSVSLELQPFLGPNFALMPQLSSCDTTRGLVSWLQSHLVLGGQPGPLVPSPWSELMVGRSPRNPSMAMESASCV